MADLPPFKAAQAAFRAGQPIDANPYAKSPPWDGDAYPGPYHEWRQGWLNAWATAEHDKSLAKAHKGVDGRNGGS
jgi:hypothetical protein